MTKTNNLVALVREGLAIPPEKPTPIALSTGQFAALTGRNRHEVWKDCCDKKLKASQPAGKDGHWKIPITELAPYLMGA